MRNNTKLWPFRLSACLIVMLFSGCEGKPIGSPCSLTEECGRGLFCDTGSPAGYCSAVCNRALPCPARSVCTRINQNEEEIYRCLQACQTNQDCLPPYQCRTIVEGNPTKVCFTPKVEE